MKKITKLVFALMLSLVSLCLVACDSGEAEEALKLLIVDPVGYVESDFQLPGTIMHKGEVYDLTWTSNNEHIVISDVQEADDVKYYVAHVVRPTNEEGAEIVVTAHLKMDGSKASKDFEYKVYPIDIFEIADAFKFDKANKVTDEEFALETATEYAGQNVTIAWSVPTEYNGVYTIENNTVKFSVTKETTVKIAATFSWNGQTTTKQYVVTLKQAAGLTPTVVTEPITGKAFIFGLKQESLGKFLYFAGTINAEATPWYLKTTEKIEEAVKVTAEAVEGGYHLSFIDASGAKKYLDIDTSGKASLYIKDAPSCVFTWDAENNTFISLGTDGVTYYMGTYNTYNTLSASKHSYISTSYPTHFYELPEQLKVVDTPVVGKTYTFGLKQESLGKNLYFAGTVNAEATPWYLKTTEDAAASTKVTVEAAEGGYYLSFIDASGAKKYLDIDTSGKASLYIKDAPSCVFTWDAENKTFISVGTDGVTYYMGTYNTYNTLSASKHSYISTSYPIHLYE